MKKTKRNYWKNVAIKSLFKEHGWSTTMIMIMSMEYDSSIIVFLKTFLQLFLYSF